jgi:hypothetical protein
MRELPRQAGYLLDSRAQKVEYFDIIYLCNGGVYEGIVEASSNEFIEDSGGSAVVCVQLDTSALRCEATDANIQAAT